MTIGQRIFYACLGLGVCGDSPLPGLKSIGFSLNRSISNIFAPGNSAPVATYGELPDVEVKYTSYLTSFNSFSSELGLNDFCGFDLYTANENSLEMNSNIELTPKITASYMLLSDITYNLSIDKPFTVDRTYKGFGKKPSDNSNKAVSFITDANLLSRRHWTGDLPAEISGNTIQDISISMIINRQYVKEFATRKPYASFIVFPIETTCTFNLIAKENLDSVNMDALQTACSNGPSYKQDIVISLCNGSSIRIEQAYLTSLGYSGGDSDSNNNLTISVKYTGFQSPLGIKPISILDDLTDPC